jgi:hypothetical protein
MKKRFASPLIGLMLIALLPLITACGPAEQEGYDIGFLSVSYVEETRAGLIWVHESTPIADADRGSFEILGQTTFAKDAQRVYYQGQEIPGADPATLETLADDPSDWSRYVKDAGQVYHWGEIIPEADPATFEVLDYGLNYARDNQQVYHAETAIAGADPATFELISISVGRDASDYYANGIPLQIDLPSFTLLYEEGGGKIWAYDETCYYYHDTCQPITDPANFEILSQSFAKDATQDYYLDSVLPGADPATFEVEQDADFEAKLARDANQCYRNGEVVACP